MFFFTISQLKDLAQKCDDNREDIFKRVMHGLQIKYGIGLKTEEAMIQNLKREVDCTEFHIETNEIDFFA